MKHKLLLIDDDPAIRQMLARLLTGEGYSVLKAESGEEAFRYSNGNQIDLALLDLNLPRESGWEIFERLTSENPLLPIVIITARPNQLFVALGAGAGALMEKPLDIPQLLKTIKDLLSETPETRLARLAGQVTDFHYSPQGRPSRFSRNPSRRAVPNGLT